MSHKGHEHIEYFRTNITMGPVGFEPTTASAPGQYLDEINQIGRVGILDQARRWPLRLRQMESFLNVVLCHFQHEIELI